MAKTVSIKVLEYHESKASGTVTLLVRGSDFLKSELPGYPNIRKASKNKVVKDIVQSIRENQAKYIFPDPIHISVKSCEKVKAVNNNGYYADMTFRTSTANFIGDGVMNGGHKRKGLEEARKEGFNLDNVYVELKIYLGLSDKQIKEKAITLNNSKAPTRLSKDNYAGHYDWLKDLLPESEYSVIYCEGDTPHGITTKQGYCQANRIAMLPVLVDITSYDGKNPTFAKRHPKNFASITQHTVNVERFEDETYQELTYLIPDLIKLQSYLGKCIQETDRGKNVNNLGKWVKYPNSQKDNTYFPDKTFLNCKIPAQTFTAPIISCFRPWLNEDLTWVDKFDNFYQKIASKLWAKFKTMLKSDKRFHSFDTALAGDVELWDNLYALSENLVKEYMDMKFVEMKKEAKKNIKTKKVA